MKRTFIHLERNLEKRIYQGGDIVTAGIHMQNLDNHYKTAVRVWVVPH